MHIASARFSLPSVAGAEPAAGPTIGEGRALGPAQGGMAERMSSRPAVIVRRWSARHAPVEPALLRSTAITASNATRARLNPMPPPPGAGVALSRPAAVVKLTSRQSTTNPGPRVLAARPSSLSSVVYRPLTPRVCGLWSCGAGLFQHPHASAAARRATPRFTPFCWQGECKGTPARKETEGTAWFPRNAKLPRTTETGQTPVSTWPTRLHRAGSESPCSI